MRAIGLCDTSPFSASDPGSLVTLPQPSAPAHLRATENLCDSVEVTWDESPDAFVYQIWRSTTMSSANAVEIGASATLSFLDTSAAPGTNYYYWAKAYRPCGGTSDFSNRDRGRAVSCP